MAKVEIDLKKEEVRGLFVIGIIASLLAARDSFSWTVQLPYGVMIDSKSIVNGFLLYWGLYAFFMVVALSDDVFNEKVANDCAVTGHFMVFFGILLSIFTLFEGLLTGPVAVLMGSQLSQWVTPLIAFAITSLFIRRWRWGARP